MLTLHPEEQKWLNEYRQVLMDRQPGAVARMLVYGSNARGDAHDDSDINVLLIVKNEAANLKRIMRRIGYATSYAVPSILASTQEEWGQRESIGSTFFETVEREAVRVL